jgi:hypothetical protein
MERTSVACKGCGIKVAPFDPERIQKGLEIWHGNCLRKKEKEDETTLRARVRDINSFWKLSSVQ